MADALPRVLPNTFPDEHNTAPHTSNPPHHVNTILSITSDNTILHAIKQGYKDNVFCKCVINTQVTGWTEANSLWYIGSCLLIPRIKDLQEMLFRLAHDTLGHFGVDKCYVSLHDA